MKMPGVIHTGHFLVPDQRSGKPTYQATLFS